MHHCAAWSTCERKRDFLWGFFVSHAILLTYWRSEFSVTVAEQALLSRNVDAPLQTGARPNKRQGLVRDFIELGNICNHQI